MKSLSVNSRLFYIFLSLLLCTSVAYAGDEWKPLNPNELAMKTPTVEKDADAEILLWEVKVDDSGDTELSLKHYLRVKVFNEKGREQFSKVEVEAPPYTKIKDVAARVTKSDGSVIELKKEDVFERTIVKVGGLKIKQKSFAAPGLEPGAILEYRYREVHEYSSAHNLELIFQRNVPIHTVSYYVRPGANGLGMSEVDFNMPPGFKFNKDSGGFFKATLTNVPALREEPLMLPVNDIRSWAMVYYTPLKEKSDANDYWAYRGYLIKEDIKDVIKPNDEVKRVTAEITASAANNEEKLAALYRYCQTQIKNTTFDHTLTDDDREKLKANKSPGDTLKRRSGNAANIDQLFMAMVRSLKIETRVALTGHRGQKFFNKGMVGPFVHISSVAVKTDEGRWRFYNPGSLYIPNGMLVWFDEGQDALLLGDKDYVWAKTPITPPEKSAAKRTGKFRLLEDGTLEGDVRIEYTGHQAYERKTTNDESSPTKREETLRDEVKARMSTAELTDIKVENVQEPDKPFVYDYKIRVPGYAQRTGKRLFLQPNFFEYGAAPVFIGSERKYSMYFNYPWSEEDNITIELPAGFTLDNADAPGNAAAAGLVEDKVNISITKDGKNLIYKRNYFFGNTDSVLVFTPTQYASLKSFFEGLNKIDTHAITLKQGAPAPAK